MIFWGNTGYCYVFTKVIDDNQFKNYYDMLSATFNEDFHEMVLLGIWGGSGSGSELSVVVNGKVITISSDNECDSWIFDKIIGPNPLKRTREK